MQAQAKVTLSSLVEEHLTSLVAEAASVNRHSKRARYSASDANNEQQHQGTLRNRIHAEDINLALQWRGSEKLYATGVVVPPGPGEDPTTKRIDLNAYVRSENRLRPPVELGMTSHWLAVDGTQPSIPQNPKAQVAHRVESDAGYSDRQTGELSMEEELQQGVSIRQLLPRLLSEELQLYFTRITIAIERGGGSAASRAQQDEALASVCTDAGLQELVPFLVRYATSQLHQHHLNPSHSRTLIRLIRCMLYNPNMHLELQLHQILPALITCVVAKQLSVSRLDDNHWALRQEAAQALLLTCNL
jgi:transcription initiation factor TFIID subunit 6